MSKGVLMYCFDNEHTQYHKLAERCVEQVKKYLNLDVTMVTNFETYKKLKPLGMVDYKLIENRKNNTRSYLGKRVPWHNEERSNAYEHSPYDTTLLIDCDFFAYTDNLLQYMDTDYDFLCHNTVYDPTGVFKIISNMESTLPIVWATICVFKKNENVKTLFDTYKMVQQNYDHYRQLYRVIHKNFRNDYALAMALHQCNGNTKNLNFFPSPMILLPPEANVLKIDDTSVTYKYRSCVGMLEKQDIHILDKEFCNE